MGMGCRHLSCNATCPTYPTCLTMIRVVQLASFEMEMPPQIATFSSGKDDRPLDFGQAIFRMSSGNPFAPTRLHCGG